MSARLRRIVHGTLLWMAVPFLLLSAASLGIFTWVVGHADRVLPDASYGNCFTYAAAKWKRWGGYVSMREADDIRLLGLPFPHAVWQSALGGAVRMTYPVARRHGVLPWWAILFRFEVWAGDSPRPAAYVESEADPRWSDTQSDVKQLD